MQRATFCFQQRERERRYNFVNVAGAGATLHLSECSGSGSDTTFQQQRSPYLRYIISLQIGSIDLGLTQIFPSILWFMMSMKTKEESSLKNVNAENVCAEIVYDSACCRVWRQFLGYIFTYTESSLQQSFLQRNNMLDIQHQNNLCKIKILIFFHQQLIQYEPFLSLLK